MAFAIVFFHARALAKIILFYVLSSTPPLPHSRKIKVDSILTPPKRVNSKVFSVNLRLSRVFTIFDYTRDLFFSGDVRECYFFIA